MRPYEYLQLIRMRAYEQYALLFLFNIFPRRDMFMFRTFFRSNKYPVLKEAFTCRIVCLFVYLIK